MKTKSGLVVLLCLVLGFVPLSNINAQEAGGSPLIDQEWVRLGGPLGGLGYDIRMGPRNPDVMYVTDAYAGVFKSVDGGRTWFPSNSGIDMKQGFSGDAVPVFCLTIDPNQPDTVWIGLQELGGVYRSDDAGETWSLKINGIKERNGLTIRGVSIEPGNSDVVYVAGEISSWKWHGAELMGLAFDRVMGVVYRSNNRGESWREIWRGNNLARYVLIDPHDVNSIYLSTGLFDREAADSDPETHYPGGEGILHSTDRGTSWERVNNGLENWYVGSLYMHPENSDILIAATGNNAYEDGGGLYMTTNGGESWEYKIGAHLSSVEISESNPDIMYAGGFYEFYGSRNGGESWMKLHHEEGDHEGWGVSAIRPGFPIDFQVDPRDPYRIFVNNYGGGNFLSEDGGNTWATASDGYTGADIKSVAIDPHHPSVVYVNGRSGLFKSVDGGVHWTGINHWRLPEGLLVVMDPGNSEHLLISEGAFPLLMHSYDMGESIGLSADYNELMWAGVEAGSSSADQQGFAALAFAPTNTQRVYGGYGTFNCYYEPEVCENGRTLYSFLVSDNGGDSWKDMDNPVLKGMQIVSVAVHPHDENILWVAAPKNGIYKSYDGGTTFEQVNTGLWDNMVMSLAVDPRNPDIVYAGVKSGGVFKSLDAGHTWAHTSAGMDPNENVMTIVLDPQRENVVYAGSISSGLFISKDSGASWRQHNAGLSTRAIRVLAISADGNTLYAGTMGEGVFRLSTLSEADFEKMAEAFAPTAVPTKRPTKVPAPDNESVKAEPESEKPVDLSSKGFCPVSYLPVVAGMFIAAWNRKKKN